MATDRFDREECAGCPQIEFLQEGTNPEEICIGCNHYVEDDGNDEPGYYTQDGELGSQFSPYGK